jgi:hypothetical protein
MNEKPCTKPIFPLLFLVFGFAACAGDAEPVARLDKTSGETYLDYQIWGEEGREDVTIRLQYRRGDEEGDAFEVEAPGQVLLDGQPLPADSTRFAGTFYELTIPTVDFTGQHTITFVDEHKKEHREEFSFAPFSLADELPENIRMKPFQIRLKNFPETATLIRMVITDTAMETADVNEELMVENGLIEVTSELLANLTAGPATLEIFQEEEKPVSGGAKKRGKLMLTYGLRREINLFR